MSDEKLTPDTTGGRAISGNFQVACNLSTARQFTIVGSIFTDDTEEEILKRVSMAMNICDKQGIRMDIVAKEAQIAQFAASMEGHQEMVAGLLDKRNKGKKLTSAEDMAIKNLDNVLFKGRENIESLQAAVAQAKKVLLNGAAPAA